MKNKKIDKTKIFSIFLLLLMVLSVFSYALLFSNNSYHGNNQNVPFGQIFQNSQTGELIYGAVLNGETFIFQNISGFETREDLREISNSIKNENSISIYVSNSSESSSIFLVEKTLKSLDKNYYFLYDENQKNESIINLENLNFNETENLVYFLIQ